jgi:recombination protein RecA
MVRKSSNQEPTIAKLSDKRDEKFIQSGITELDDLIGGIPCGRILELWGAEGVGKTFLVTQLMVNLSKDHKILFVDTEFALNKQRVEDLGVVMDNVDYIADSRLERVCELLVASVGKYDLIILDSLAYLTPLTIDSNEIGETNIGLFARLIKHWVVKFRPRLGVSKTAFIAINQYRSPIGLYVKAEPPGGKSWGHAVDVRIYLTSNKSDRIEEKGKRIAHYVHMTVVKSKVSAPFKDAKLRVSY